MGFPHSSIGKESACNARDPSWVGKIPWRRERLPTPVVGFFCGSAGKESTCNVGDLGQEDPLKKGEATHSSILVWRIPWTIAHGVTKSRTRLSTFRSSRVNSVALSPFTTFCNHHHYLFPELFHHPEQKLDIHSTITPHFPSSADLYCILLSVSMNLPIQGNINGMIQYLSSSFRHIPLNIMLSRSLRVRACVRNPSLFKATLHCFVCMWHVLLFHSPVNEHLGHIHILVHCE